MSVGSTAAARAASKGTPPPRAGAAPLTPDVSRARSLGLTADASFEAIVRAYIEDELR